MLFPVLRNRRRFHAACPHTLRFSPQTSTPGEMLVVVLCERVWRISNARNNNEPGWTDVCAGVLHRDDRAASRRQSDDVAKSRPKISLGVGRAAILAVIRTCNRFFHLLSGFVFSHNLTQKSLKIFKNTPPPPLPLPTLPPGCARFSHAQLLRGAIWNCSRTTAEIHTVHTSIATVSRAKLISEIRY